MQSVNENQKKAQNGTKKAFAVLRTILFCFSCAVCVVLSVAVLFLSLSKTPENTLQAFGYKFYCAETDIEEIGIQAGSLVVVRDTGTDDFYTYDTLSKNVVFTAEKLGFALKYNAFWMVLCVTVPIMLFFLINLMSGFKKRSIEREENEAFSEIDSALNDAPTPSQDEYDLV